MVCYFQAYDKTGHCGEGSYTLWQPGNGDGGGGWRQMDPSRVHFGGSLSSPRPYVPVPTILLMTEEGSADRARAIGIQSFSPQLHL